MFMSRTNNVQKLGNLKPLLRTKTVECVSALLNSKQSNRLSSSNDGDRINDEKFEKQTTTTTASSSTKTDEKHTQQSSSSSERNVNNKSQFISIEIFGPKDVRLPLPGNVGFITEKYLKDTKKANKTVKQEFKLIADHNPQLKECLTSTIEFNLNHYETNEDRQNRIVENVVYNSKYEQSLERNQSKFKSLFFVKVYTSTQFLLNDIKKIFPKECLFEKDFVIISVYKNPFTKITDVSIKDEFVNLANSITYSLNKVGCWTNFIMPDSKRSYADLITCLNEESDNRFVNYGIEIEEHADCKYINQINNAKLFIGSVFTSAKINSVELNQVLSLLTPL